MQTKRFNITGMTCSACSAHIERTVSGMTGVSEVNVNLLANNMTVEFDPAVVSTDSICDAVASGGYGAAPIEAANTTSTAAKPTAKPDEAKAVRLRLIVSIICLVPLMYIAMGHMISLPMPPFLSMDGMNMHQNAIAFAFTQLLLTIPILYVNRDYFISGFKALFRRVPNMNSLIAIGSAAAVFYGVYAIYKMGYALGVGDMTTLHSFTMNLYFESAGMILTLITLGKFLEARAKGKTSDAISKLMELAPDEATVLRDGVEQTIPTSEVQRGDIVVVRAGGVIPTDGVIESGDGYADESAVTGESMPVFKQNNDKTTGGTLLKSGYIQLRATTVGSDSTLSKIIELVESAASSKAEISKMADRVSRIFVPAVIAISIITFIVWMVIGSGTGLEYALSAAISVLVISCPCALGLATPTAIMVGTGKGAQHGILIKSAHSLEVLHEVKTVVLDKTGTITMGQPAVTDVLPQGGYDKQKLLNIAAALEHRSEHPLAQAVMTYTANQGITPATPDSFETHAGQGVSAVIEGIRYRAGSADWMRSLGLTPPALDTLENGGKTPLCFADETQVIGVIAVMDTVKPTSKQAIAALHNMGLRTLILTGDNPRTAEAVRALVGADEVIAGVMPDRKEAEVRRLMADGSRVAMIGDGINDSPALAAADVGIAIGAGTDIAIEAADLVLMRSDLNDAVTAVSLSRATIRNIKQNLFWALFYNALCIPLAAGVFQFAGIGLNPMVASAAMSLSSLFVVGNALRLRLFKPSITTAETEYISNDKEEKEIVKAMTKTINVEGMSCGHCKAHVEKALSAVEGVTSAVVSLEEKKAVVTLAHDVPDSVLADAVVAAGFEVRI